MITFNYLMAQALIVLNAKLKKENTAKRVGGLIRDLLLYIQNIILGIILKGDKENEAAIKAISNPTRGDTYKSLDTGHYWCYDGTQWNDIGELIPSNLVTKDELSQLENKVFNSDSKINAIIDSDAVEISLGTTTGALLKSGLVSTSATAYLRTTVTNAAAMLALEKGATYTYTGEIDNVNYAGVCYYDSSLNPIGYQFDTGNYADEPLAYPDSAAYAGFCGKGGFTVKRTTSFLKLSQEEGFGSKEAMSQDAISKAIRDALGSAINGKREYNGLAAAATKSIHLSFPLRAGIVYKLYLTVDTTAIVNFNGVAADGTSTLIGSFGTVTSIGKELLINPTADYDHCSLYFGAASVASIANLSIEIQSVKSIPEVVGVAENLYPDPFCLLQGNFTSESSVQTLVVVGTPDYSTEGKIILPPGTFLGVNLWQSELGITTGTDYLNTMFLGTKPENAAIAIRVDEASSGSFGYSYPLASDNFYNGWMSLYNSKSASASLSGRIQIMFDNRNGASDLVVERFYLWKGFNTGPDGLFLSDTQKAIVELKTGNWANGLVKDSELFTTFSQEVSLAKAVGAITKTGTIANGASNYLRTTLTNTNTGFMITIDPTKGYRYSGEIDNSNYCGVLYKSESMAVVGYECGNIVVYDKFEMSPPANAKYIAFCGKGGFVVEQLNKILKTELVPSESGGGLAVRYVDGAVAVSGDGSKDSRYKTITEAIEDVATKGSGLIVVKDYADGYRETLPLAKLKTGSFKIVPEDPTKGFKVLGSNKLTGWTKTSGYTNIYELPFTGSIPAFARLGGALLFEDGNPSKPIEARHFHPLQKNLIHRLPFSPIYPKDSITDVESNPATYFYDTVNGKLYIHTSNSDNPETNTFSYEVIARGFNSYVAPASQTEKVELEMDKATFMFGTAFIARGFTKMTRRFCTALACTNAGAWQNDSGFIETFFEEAGFCNNDGENSHFSAYSGYATLENNRTMSPTVIHRYLWTHDNGDDGESSHELHNVVLIDSLFEFNGDSGCRPSNDATYYAINCLFRNNGWEVTINGTNIAPNRGGEGFAVVNPVSPNPNRIGCRAVLFGCVFEENNVGLAAISQANNYVESINGISRNNNTEVYAASGAKVVLRNHRASNLDPDKIIVKVSGGEVEVLFDEVLKP